MYISTSRRAIVHRLPFSEHAADRTALFRFLLRTKRESTQTGRGGEARERHVEQRLVDELLCLVCERLVYGPASFKMAC